MGINADGYHKFDDGELRAIYMVSPEFTLDAVRNIVSFSERKRYFGDAVTDEALFVVREIGGEWTVVDMDYKAGNIDQMTSTGDFDIPAQFNGKKVQVAFKYVTNATGTTSGIWDVANLLIKKGEAKQEPAISFSETEVTFDLTEEGAVFTAPEFINPNNVSVKFSSSNPEVATVDETTGDVTIVSGGVTVIKAISEETSEFVSAEAEYTLTVNAVPTCIEGITAEELEDSEIYDIQGRKVNKLEKGIYIVNGKKVIVR